MPNVSTAQPFGGTPWPIPGQIEMEDYDLGGEGIAYHDVTAGNSGNLYRSDDVDIWESPTEGFYTGSNKTGEWLEYTVDVASAGNYLLEVRLTTPNDGRLLHVEFNGVDISGTIAVPNTGSWENWQTISVPVTLTAGQQVMRLAVDNGGLNVNWINIIPFSFPPTSTHNNPLSLAAGATGSITSAHLQFDDADNPANEVIYTVTAGPNEGNLNLTTFSQQDINDGLLTYTHNGTQAFNDSFTFTVSDGINAVTDNVFKINDAADSWTRWERSFISSNIYANPYSDITLSVTYTGPSGQTIQTYGFWDGGDLYKIRFMFPEPGLWTWQTTCSDPSNSGLHNQTGTVNVSPYAGTNHLYNKGYIKVSNNNRYLTYADDTPFLWLADTAWSLPVNATQAEWETYINNRSSKQFNISHIHIANDFTDFSFDQDAVDLNGNGPFFGDNFSLEMWNPAFWQEYERKIQYANEQGIIVSIVGIMEPRRYIPIPSDSPALQIFARNFAARFIGNHVILIPNQDIPYMELGNEVGQALRDAAPFHLITQHTPFFDDRDGDGDNDSIDTALLYYDQPYMSTAGIQTGAGWNDQPGFIFENELAAQNAIQWNQVLYNHTPHKPVINLESVYDTSIRHDPNDPHNINKADIYLPRLARSTAYWSLLSGASGYSYAVGQLWAFGPGRDPQLGHWPWYEAVDKPSSFEMQYLYQMFTGLEWWRLVPRHELIVSQPATWLDRMVLAKTDTHDLAVAYLPDNAEIILDMSAFDNAMLATWFDPVNNVFQPVQGAIAPADTFTFIKPATWQDAILIIERTPSDNSQSPVLDPIGAQSVEEGELVSILVTATDADGPAPLLLTATGLPNGATFTDNGSGNGTFSWSTTSGDAAASPYFVTFTATDDNGDGLSASEVVQIDVSIVNAAPVLTPIGAQNIQEGQLLSIPVVATDIGGPTPLLLNATNLPIGAAFIDNGGGNGMFTWAPATGDATGSPYNVTFTATDDNGNGLSTNEVVAITVTPTSSGQTPILAPIAPQNTDELAQLSFNVSATDADGPANELVLTATGVPTGATFTDNSNGNGTFDWTPGSDTAGTYYVTFIVTDSNGSGLIDSEVAQITVVAVDQAPVLNTIGAQTIEEGLILNFPITATDDGPASELRLTATGLPGGATFTDNGNGNGTFDWTPGSGTAGPYNVTFIVTDLNGSGQSVNEMVPIIVTAPSGGQSPFGGSPWPIPGQIELENYDQGGEGIAYHDLNIGNKGGVYRSDDVDIWLSTTEGYYTGANKVGEWLEFMVDVATAGSYQLELRFATPNSNRRVHVEFDGVNVSGPVTLPNTGGWQAWQTLSVPVTLNAGQQIMRVAVDGNGMNLNWVRLTASTGGDQAPFLNPIGPQTIEEGLTLNFPVTATDDGPAAEMRLTATGLPGSATFTDNGNGNGTFDWIPATGMAGTYNVIFTVTDLNGAGQSDSEMVQIIVSTPGGGQSPFGGSPWPIPGQIELEDYDLGGEGIAYHDSTLGNKGIVYRNDDVDIWLSDTEGYYTGANRAGEWLEFTVDVASAGDYLLELRFATPKDNRRVRVAFDGVNVSGTITLPNTGDWQAWQTLSVPVTLSAGQQIMRVSVDDNGMNLSWVRLTLVGGN